MKKVDFQDGVLVTPAKVEIDGVEHQVTPAVYSGTTPVSKHTLNLMQDNIEEEINSDKIYTYTMTATVDTELGAEVELPFWYKVRKWQSVSNSI